MTPHRPDDIGTGALDSQPGPVAVASPKAEEANASEKDLIAKWLPLFFEPDDVLEVRMFDAVTASPKIAGYLIAKNIPRLAARIAEAGADAGGVYFTLQRLNPAVLDRSKHSFPGIVKDSEGVSRPKSVSHEDVTQMRWVFVDVDSAHPSGVSATDSEKAAAWEVATAVKAWLADQGWPNPIVNDSGNGYHLFYRVMPGVLPIGPGGDVAGGKLNELLGRLQGRFGTAGAKVDTSVGNPARLARVPGTYARKGIASAERPHRMAVNVENPAVIPVTAEQFTAALEGLPPADRGTEDAKAGDRSGRSRRTLPESGGGTPYGLAALQRECAEVRAASGGNRNVTFNAACFAAGQLVGGGELTEDIAREHLIAVGYEIKLEKGEPEKTFRSGFQAGLKKPRSAPGLTGAVASPGSVGRDKSPKDKADKKASGSGEKGPSLATMIADYVAKDYDLFRGPDGTAYAAGDKGLCYPIKEVEFQRCLTRIARVFNEDEVPGQDAIRNVTAYLDALAADGKTAPVYLRTAEVGGRVYVHLNDESGTVAQVGADGWKLITNPLPVHFLATKNAKPLPLPDPAGSLDELRALVNVHDDDDFKLLVAWITGAFRTSAPHPILSLVGEEGTAKTTMARMLVRLIDPRKPEVRAEPHDQQTLMVAARNAWVLAYDNLSGVPKWLADDLCRIVTGGGASSRQLYTNGDEFVFDARRPVILTGIDDPTTQSDLLSRILPIRLVPIPTSERRNDAELDERFEAAYPRILGAIFNTVSAGLAKLPGVRLASKPRMADFATWAAATVGEDVVATRYAESISEAKEKALEDSILIAPLRSLMKDCYEWQGSATDLLSALGHLGGDKNSKKWPGGPNRLSALLNRIAPSLREIEGLNVGPGRAPGGSRSRHILISRAVTSPSNDAKGDTLPREDFPSTVPFSPRPTMNERDVNNTSSPAPRSSSLPPPDRHPPSEEYL